MTARRHPLHQDSPAHVPRPQAEGRRRCYPSRSPARSDHLQIRAFCAVQGPAEVISPIPPNSGAAPGLAARLRRTGRRAGVNIGIMGRVRLASYARTKDSQEREEPGDRLPPYDPGRSGQPPGTDGRQQDAMETCVGVPRGVPVGTGRRSAVLAARLATASRRRAVGRTASGTSGAPGGTARSCPA